MKPTAYMLCGLTGAGKSTYACKLSQSGAYILSIDHAVFDKFGMYGVDYPEEKIFELEAKVKPDLEKQLIKLLGNGRDVVLDYGFWKQKSRDEHKRIIEENGGIWRLLYFKVPKDILLERLIERNKNTGPEAIPVSEKDLNSFINRFEEPIQEGEEIMN